MKDENLITLEKVMEWLKISEATLRRLERTGEIRASMIGGQLRFEPKEIRSYIKKTRRNSK